MAAAQTSELFDCSPKDFYKIISDYEKYSEFLPEVKKAKVIKTEGTRKLVELQVSVIKSFTYSIWITEDPPNGISWEFATGDVFKTNKGGWKIKEEGGKTRVEYFVDATFSMFVPGPVAKALVSVNLPNMMGAYRKRVSQVVG